ncbi:hypothetical protein NP493_12g03027 [Ridgeia piscesae]|uniref:Ubiquitin fusion degradation protein UFD1 n=1 Tax=Ridgeia piscesae TaxID=27915 RepID=A0AAD9PF28_RIDPI|nr:hypothetical protein NP493_12g03027 [Ridgeia piscesae]
MFSFGFQHDGMPRTFSSTYSCYSVSMLPGQEREDVEKGGKIIMPPSALDQLTRLNIQYPMLFKLTNKKTDRETHCGVLEFIADEGRIYVPYWMMRNLLLEEGSLVYLENISLPVATYAKFEPQSTEFLDITNPKAVLENALRIFACLTKGDMIAIKYNERIYELSVLETKPGNAVSIIECDMNVEFAAPVGYKDETDSGREKTAAGEEEAMAVDVEAYIANSSFRAFTGQGNRLDGKKKNTELVNPKKQQTRYITGIPNYNYKRGKLTFIRTVKSQADCSTSQSEQSDFEAFSGEGQSLRKKHTRK